jgi:hypothetical protein
LRIRYDSLIRAGIYLVLVLMAAGLARCGKADMHRQRQSAVDSLTGAVSAVSSALKNIDTVQLQKAMLKFGYYRQFIRQNIHDTLQKAEAGQLQHFYQSGNALGNFFENRRLILARANIATSQFKKLSYEISRHTFDITQADVFVANERIEAARLLQAGNSQLRGYYERLETFRLSLHEVEKIIRSHNGGEMPVIINEQAEL